MAKILADKQIRKLFGSVLLNAEKKFLNPNGIELRLGKVVLFQSTGEEKTLEPGQFLNVVPGESASISSLEKIDFTSKTVQKVYPDCSLMGLVTPTTTMMREGISQVTTKIDSGFVGVLNWGLRNSSIKDLILEYGEPIFKLTIFLLDKDESPDINYGDREKDSYQNSEGIVRSKRSIPADIPKKLMVTSNVEKIDPKKQLQEAGYPFNHIGTELIALHGKFELVSSDVRVMKEEFSERTKELSGQIDSETRILMKKIEETKDNVLEKVESLLTRKFLSVSGVIIGAIPVLYGALKFLQSNNVGDEALGIIAIISGIVIGTVAYMISKR